MFDPNDYRYRTHEDEVRAETQRTWEREHECHRKDCDAALDETKACGDCGEHFCDLHLYDGYCMKCFAIDEAADALIHKERHEERKAA